MYPACTHCGLNFAISPHFNIEISQVGLSKSAIDWIYGKGAFNASGYWFQLELILNKSHGEELILNLSLNIKGFHVKVKCSFCSVHNEPNWLHCCLNYIWRIYWASLIETLNWRIAVVQVSGIEAKLISLKIELKLKLDMNSTGQYLY